MTMTPTTRMNKLLYPIFCLLLAASATSATAADQGLTFGPGPETAGRALDAIVAVVDDDVITRQELDAATARAETQLRARKAPMPPHPVLEAQVLERLILSQLQARAAERQGISIDDATLNAAIETLAQHNKMSLSQLRQTVEKDGISFAQFRDEVRRELLGVRLRQKLVDSQVRVSEQDVESLTAQSGGPLLAAEAAPVTATSTDTDATSNSGPSDGSRQYRMAQLLIGLPEGASTRQTEETKQQAEAVLARLQQGADFTQTATRVSSSQTTDGGDLGWRTADQLPTLFSELAPRMKLGELRMVPSPGGFHIVKLIAVRGGAAPPPARVAQTAAAPPATAQAAQVAPQPLSKEQSREALMRRRADEEWNMVLRRLRDEAYVEIRLRGASLPTGSAPAEATAPR